MKRGKLYLIPSGLGENTIEEKNHITPFNLAVINNLDEFIVENERTARRYLSSAGYNKAIKDIKFHILDEHILSQNNDLSYILKPLEEGKDVGLLSESGSPCIADPGADIVRLAHNLNIQVIPLSGASSIMLALMASGFNGQKFTFHGYLPIDKSQRIKMIKQMENDALAKKQTQIFIETPYRNVKLLQDLTAVLRTETKLCIACNLTQKDEYVFSTTINQWKKLKPDINKKPAVFLIYC